jgi:PAS domain S-box-containing protein
MATTDSPKYINTHWKNRLITENLVDAIWVVDATTLKYEYMTASIEKISGYTVEEYIGFTLQDRLAPKSYQKVRDLIAKETKAIGENIDTMHTMELEAIHKNGNKYWIEISAKPARGPDKKLKIVGTTKEITERKQAEKKQKKLTIELQKALSDKDALLKEMRQLRELLPICSGCKRIRDENDKWWPLDLYIRNYTKSEITHTICPDCRGVLYDE